MRGSVPPDARAVPPSILVVDDDAGLLAALCFAFEMEGMAVEAYSSAEAALAAAPARHDCLIFDQRLPGVSGLELLERLRQRGETAPALLITSNPVAATRNRASAAGVEIVEKPLLQGVLVQKVRQLL